MQNKMVNAVGVRSRFLFFFSLFLRSSLALSQGFYTPSQDLGGLKKNTDVNATLPNVLIIGDSVSIGYTKPVMELLKGKANVQRVPVNCGNTKTALTGLDKWLGDIHWDIISFNWGLHDLCYRSPDSFNQNG